MKSFTDSAGRTWTLNITVDAIRRVRDLVGVNLADVTAPGSAPESDSNSDGVPLMTRLDTDLILLCDVIYAIVKPQADEHPSGAVSDEHFGRALGGEAIMSAHDAFWEALADFFRQVRRHDQVRAIQKQQKLVSAAVAAADRQIEGIEVDQILKQAMEGEPPPRWAESFEETTSGGGR